MTKCPICGWYYRSINRELGLYECSNPKCNSILQYIVPKPIKQKQPVIQTNLEIQP